MAKYTNVSRTPYITAKGTHIAPGASVDLSDDEAKNVSVAEWIKSGNLVTPKEARQVAKEEANADENGK